MGQGGTEPTDDYTFFVEMGKLIVAYEQAFLHIRVSCQRL
jgi:hypothetical protein